MLLNINIIYFQRLMPSFTLPLRIFDKKLTYCEVNFHKLPLIKLINQFHINDTNLINPIETSAFSKQKPVSQFKSQTDCPVSTKRNH